MSDLDQLMDLRGIEIDPDLRIRVAARAAVIARQFETSPPQKRALRARGRTDLYHLREMQRRGESGFNPVLSGLSVIVSVGFMAVIVAGLVFVAL
jgi:hypothetical protein